MSPLDGAIPYCSAIPAAYESQFWRESMEASRTFIHLLATDKSVADIEIRGLTLRKIARHELRPGIKHRCLRATAYMYPFCVEPRRLEIIAVLMIMLFLFDGMSQKPALRGKPLMITYCRQVRRGRKQPSA